MGTGQPELHYETIDSRARPARVAVLVDVGDSDWRQTVLRVIEFLSSIWGGKHSVIVPTDGATIAPHFWTILEKFSPDYVYYYQKTGEDIRISDPSQYAEQLHAEIARCGHDPDELLHERIDQELRKIRTTRFAIKSNLCSQIANRVVPFHFEEHMDAIQCNDYVPYQLTAISNVLPYIDAPREFTHFQIPTEIDAAWHAAHTGVYSDQVAQQLQDLGFKEATVIVVPEMVGDFVRWISGGELNNGRQALYDALDLGPGFAPPGKDSPTPFEISMAQVGYYGRPQAHSTGAQRFAFVIGNSLEDYCLAYNLSRIGYRSVWLPLKWIDGIERNQDSILKTSIAFAVSAVPTESVRNSRFRVCSASLANDDVEKELGRLKQGFGSALKFGTVVSSSASEVALSAANHVTPYCIDSPNNLAIWPFLGQKSVGGIRSPLPSGFRAMNATKHRWVVDVEVLGQAIPSIPDLAGALIDRGQFEGSTGTRLTGHKLAYTCPAVMVFGDNIHANLPRPPIKLFDIFDAVSSLAQSGSLQCQLSDKGIYQRDSLEKLGGIAQAARILRDLTSCSVFRKFLDDSVRGKGTYDEGCALSDKRSYLDLAAVSKIMRGNDEAATLFVDNLVASRVLYRGFILGCGICKHVGWYSLGELSDAFQCTRCGRQQLLRREHWKHPASPQIFYKLDEIVYQFLKSDGDVTALALDYMAQNSSHSFHYTPEIKFHGDSPLAGEIDLCAVWNGMLTIGEAKKQGELALKDRSKIIQKYVGLAELLHARQVVFCTTSPQWRQATYEQILEAFKGKLAVPIFLTASQLLTQTIGQR